MSVIYSIFILLLIPVLAFAQLDKANFEKIFEQESFDSKYDTRESHSSKYTHTSLQNLPEWFCNLPASKQNEIYAIGISDPEPDTSKALSQATFRALIIASVLHQNITQLLCDYYIDEAEETRDIVYEHFSRINTFLPAYPKYSVEKVYRNLFDETIVLVKYIPGIIDSNKYKVSVELYKNEIESTVYGSYESLFEMKVTSYSTAIPDPMYYQLTEFGDRYRVESIWDDSVSVIPIYSLQYEYYGGDTLQHVFLSHGLWKDFFKSISVSIINKAREKPENIKYIQDVYQRTSTEKITQGISANKMSLILKSIYFSNNTLNVEIINQN